MNVGVEEVWELLWRSTSLGDSAGDCWTKKVRVADTAVFRFKRFVASFFQQVWGQHDFVR